MKDYEETIAFLGQWGRFQQIIFFLLCISTIPNGTGVLSIIYVADIPSHHCKVPDVNLTQAWLSVIIPVKVVNGKEEVSKCSRYRLDVVRNLSAQGLIPGTDVNVTDLEEESCLDGWSYSKDIYQSTIVSEFDLVCSEQWKQPFSSTVYFIGVLAGSFGAGQISDRYGRKPVFFTTIAVQVIFTFVQIFSPSWTVFAILLFVSGLGQYANYLSAFVLGTETLTGKVRVLFSTLGVCLCYAIGFMILPFIAYFLRDWKSLLLAVSLPALLYLPLWWFIPESPRWLVSQGRVDEAEAIVRKAAKQNRIEAPAIIFTKHNVAELKSEDDRRYSVFDMVRTSDIRTTTFILFLLWFTLLVGYYGLSLNSAQLTADPYTSAFISAAVEVPAYISSWLGLQYLPRRMSVSASMVVGGVSLFFIQLVPDTLSELSIALEMLGKYCLTTGSAMVFAFTAEIYPTPIRSTATGACATCSRVGSCIAPFLFQLGAIFKFLPYILLGSLSVLGAFLTIFLPETFGKPLPQTFDQMYKRESIKCPCIGQKEAPDPTIVLESEL